MFIDRNSLKPLSRWELSSGDIEFTRCKSTVKAICFGLVSSANYHWSDVTIFRCKLHCERVSFCFAVRWRCVCCSLALFPKHPSPSFLSESLWFYVNWAWFSNSRVLFVYILTSFISNELSLFLDLVTWFKPDVLVVPPRDYQLRHLAVIPLRICLVRRRPD